MTSDDFKQLGIKPLIELRSSKLRLLLEYWAHAKGSAELPARDSFRPEDWGWMLPNLVMIDVTHSPRRYFYRQYGTNVASFIGADLTNRYVDELQESDFKNTVNATYDKVVEGRQPVAAERYEFRDSLLLKYECVVLPYTRHNGGLDTLMIGLDFHDDDASRFFVSHAHKLTTDSKCRDPRLQKLFEMWCAGKSGDDLPPDSFIDPLNLKFILGNLLVFQVNDDEPRFVYRLVGTNIVGIMGRDMTGLSIDDHPIKEMAYAYRKGLATSVEERQPLRAEILRPSEDKRIASELLVLPLMDEQKKIRKILIGQVYQVEPSYQSLMRRPLQD